MTIEAPAAQRAAGPPGDERPVFWTARRRLAVGAAAALAWAIGRAGLGDELVNEAGWSSFVEFWASATSPQLAGDFVRLTVDAAAITLAYAVLGTAVALAIGAAGALVLSERLAGPRLVGRIAWRVARAVMVVPRAIHEVLWALLFLEVFGFDPVVAVLAIGVPFGAVTAKVFAEAIDEADPAAYLALRATGAGRLAALGYGIAPTIRGDLLSYAFYRLECAIRSAAVLGVIGAGGLGFQLDLSFESLRYDEIWTFVVALMILSGLADAWSGAVRRARSPRVGRWSMIGVAALIPLSLRWTGLDPTSLWSARSRREGGELLDDLIPPRLGPGGWDELIGATVDTVAMSILALAIAGGGALVLAPIAGRPSLRSVPATAVGRVGRGAVRLVLLLFRAVPAPVWAFLVVLVLFPGLWPGAVALGVYNLGVVGRLFAEAIEEQHPGPTDALARSGAGAVQRFAYGTLPVAAPRLVSLGLYRWEVIARETVVVGVVGAGGLGQLINEHLAARDWAAISGALVALVVMSLAIDTVSSAVRRALR